MKFKLRRCSQSATDDPGFPGAYEENGAWYVEIADMQQLISQLGENKSPKRKSYDWNTQGLVMEAPTSWEPEYTLTIYDDYLE